MKKLKAIILIFLTVTLAGTVGHFLFYIFYHSLIQEGGEDSLFAMLWHGLQLDIAIAGYVSYIPSIILLVSIFYYHKALRWLWNGYFAIVAFLISLANIANIGLYSYWGFPLDTTPLFYVFTSPKDAAASITWWMWVLAIVSLCIFTIAIAFPLFHIGNNLKVIMTRRRNQIIYSLILLLITAALIIPVRGGFDVSTNNTGKVYFSSNQRLNHAAVNPVFSFMESWLHQEDFGDKYRFMDNRKADKIFSELTDTTLCKETRDQLLTTNPNIIIIVLESFSKHLTDERGEVVGVTPTINSLIDNACYFDSVYANSFRTDRGLVSILSGYPAQPTMSIMKYPSKTANLPSIARTLSRHGYATGYYYGGDADFTNMRSYLTSTGFQKITSQPDFPVNEQQSKWGAYDEFVFRKALKDIKAYQGKNPFMKVIQTSTSHEPFEVPATFHPQKMYEIHNGKKEPTTNKCLTAFAYTDHYLGEFLTALRSLPQWDNTLIIISPDHQGCYPENMPTYSFPHFEIPIFMTGGAIRQPQRIHTLGSQHDIAATVLAMLGYSHKDFTFSIDLFDKNAPHFAFFDHPDAMGMITHDNSIFFDNTSNRAMINIGCHKGENIAKAQAYLQKLYDDIAAR